MTEDTGERITRRSFLKLILGGAAAVGVGKIGLERITPLIEPLDARFGEKINEEPVWVRVVNVDTQVNPEDRGWVRVRSEPTVNSDEVGKAVANNPEAIFQADVVIGAETGARTWKDEKTGRTFGFWLRSDEIPGLEGGKLRGHVSSVYIEEVEPPPETSSSSP